MEEVYRDTKLGRDVALKTLVEALTAICNDKRPSGY
jgi:hypothetical protein